MSVADHTSVSVTLCTYQGERYLQAQLDSLLVQSRLPDEIVIFDDASIDATWSLLQDFQRQATARGIRVRAQANATNVGYVANFQQALNAATGDLLFLCDQDDVWHSDKIERFVQEFQRRGDLLMLHSDARLVDAQGASLGDNLLDTLEVTSKELETVHVGRAFDVLLRRNIVTGATMAVRRRVIERGFNVPPGWIHDEWLAMTAAAQGRIDCLEAQTIDYRQHDRNQIGVRRQGYFERLFTDGTVHGELMVRMRDRIQTLLDLAEEGAFPLNGHDLESVRERLIHARLRANPPRNVMARIAAVRREYATGRYVRFSNGPRSAISDLVRRRP
ncbi:MAG: glycosyltransferase family 2 protein [Pseudomonas sp.]|uniref:glycosyltransferase family 2 protein n=1 Tax=Pseudomonas sp. TaxID=306 RepID=UPI001221D7F1|nr:glycosyltransferase family 2 protein [Pseudomonas sp.]RZI71990.1 MAG: glycosyltransferase family 2 protein [Pseudomonas sp.]